MQDVLWFYTENHTKNGYSLVKYIQIDSNTINRVKRPPISAIITKNKSPVVKLPHYSSHNPWDIIFMKTETTLCEISNSRRYVGTRGIMPLGGQFRFWAKKKRSNKCMGYKAASCEYRSTGSKQNRVCFPLPISIATKRKKRKTSRRLLSCTYIQQDDRKLESVKLMRWLGTGKAAAGAWIPASLPTL